MIQVSDPSELSESHRLCTGPPAHAPATMPKGARKAAAEAAAAKLVEAAEVEAEALGARYTVAQAIEWGKKHYGDDEGWDEACWEAWALARSDVDKDEVTSSASLSLLAAAEAARPPSPTQSDLAMLAAADAMDVCACQALCCTHRTHVPRIPRTRDA